MNQELLDKITQQIQLLLNTIADQVDDEAEYLNVLSLTQKLFNSTVQSIIQETNKMSN